jgi:signal transduction histidine kinase
MTTRRRWRRSTIRVRLSLLYAGALFIGGAALVAAMYVILGEALDSQDTARVWITEHLPELTSGEPASQEAAHEAQEDLRAQFEQDRDDTLKTMLVASLIALGAVGVIAGGVGWLVAGRALHPLQQITATARRVADRSLQERIALDGPDDEVKDLADTFDAMLERLDRAFDSQRRFVANASHELRTPLTINRTVIEVALDNPQANEPLRQLGATLLAVNQRHERLIDGLLTLASSEQGITDLAPVDLADIARHVTNESEGAADRGGIEIRAELHPAPVTGDPVLLERLTQNLLDNAIRYNLPEHGEITVTTDTVNDEAHLDVVNTGPPVPPYDVASLFEPFRRLSATERLADSTSTAQGRGAGLGLSIVRSVAHAHGGDVTASPRTNGGLIVQVRMPAASHAPSERQASSSRRSADSRSDRRRGDDAGAGRAAGPASG